MSKEPVRTTTKKGYVAIYMGEDFGARLLDASSTTIYERKEDCQNNCDTDSDFLTVAIVTWQEEEPDA